MIIKKEVLSMKIFKRMYSIILTVSVLFCGNVYAMGNSIADNTKAKVFVDNNNLRITRSKDDNNIYKVIHNKRNNTIQVTVTDLKTNTSSSGPVVPIAETNIKTMSASDRSPAIRSPRTQENTISNFEYLKWLSKPNNWQIRRPMEGFDKWYYFDAVETDNNRDALNEYQNIVEQINLKEFELIGYGGVALVSTIIAAVASASNIASSGKLTPTVSRAIVAATVATSKATYETLAYINMLEKAYELFFEVVKHS